MAMSRSAVALAALLILPNLAQAQDVAVSQERTHEVVRGETLWELAGRYLGDPFRWPLIYEANRDTIADPHWIYPGEIFVIPGLEGLPAEVQAVAVVTPGQVGQERAAAGSTTAGPCPGKGDRTVFYEGAEGDRGCEPFRPPDEERSAFYTNPAAMVTPGGSFDINARARLWEAVPRGLAYAAEWLIDYEAEPVSLGKVQSLSGPQEGRALRDRARPLERVHVEVDPGVDLNVGDLLQAFHVSRDGKDLGQVIRPTGVLVVTAIEPGGAVAAVSAEFHQLKKGDLVGPVPDYGLVPGAFAQEVSSNLTAKVKAFSEDRTVYSFGDMAFLEVGEDQGVTIGDEFAAYMNDDEGWSGQVGARLQVVRVDGDRATARVIVQNDVILEPGIELRLVKKMQ